MTQQSVSQRLYALRDAMASAQIDAYIVTNNDPHSSEYSADHWLARRWISGFTGSAGNVVVTLNGGGLWTDGRYYIQGAEQLKGTDLSLFKAKLAETPTIAEWLAMTLPEGSTVGVDGRSISQQFYTELVTAFDGKGIQLVLDKDLITPIWAERTPRPDAALFNHSVKYSGEETHAKLARLRDYLTQNKAQALLVSTLDDVMWALNVRGGDTAYCPISEGYLLVEADAARFFVDSRKLTQEVTLELARHGVTCFEYEEVTAALNRLPVDTKLIFNGKNTDALLISKIDAGIHLVDKPCVVTDMKAQKNSTELAGMEEALRQDGAAVVRFMKWLDGNVPGGKVTELSAEQALQGFRQDIPGYIKDSFRTIAGYAEHGAKMHYAANSESDVTVGEKHFFLVDSGGQYPGGTTDITRTFHFGAPSAEERFDYTLVLKAVIRLSQARFLKGSTGANLDILARGVLWQHGIDYKCGTGHGVGICLNVHEGPQNFSQNPAEVALKPGMVITNEPGVYREGVHGVRIENIMKVVEAEENEFGTFYAFDSITLAPIATKMIEKSLLEPNEIDWLNRYHQRCFDELCGYLDAETQAWLKNATQPI